MFELLGTKMPGYSLFRTVAMRPISRNLSNISTGEFFIFRLITGGSLEFSSSEFFLRHQNSCPRDTEEELLYYITISVHSC